MIIFKFDSCFEKIKSWNTLRKMVIRAFHFLATLNFIYGPLVFVGIEAHTYYKPFLAHIWCSCKTLPLGLVAHCLKTLLFVALKLAKMVA